MRQEMQLKNEIKMKLITKLQRASSEALTDFFIHGLSGICFEDAPDGEMLVKRIPPSELIKMRGEND